MRVKYLFILFVLIILLIFFPFKEKILIPTGYMENISNKTLSMNTCSYFSLYTTLFLLNEKITFEDLTKQIKEITKKEHTLNGLSDSDIYQIIQNSYKNFDFYKISPKISNLKLLIDNKIPILINGFGLTNNSNISHLIVIYGYNKLNNSFNYIDPSEYSLAIKYQKENDFLINMNYKFEEITGWNRNKIEHFDVDSKLRNSKGSISKNKWNFSKIL